MALLLEVELLAHRSRSRQHTETQPAELAAPTADRAGETDTDTAPVITLLLTKLYAGGVAPSQ